MSCALVDPVALITAYDTSRGAGFLNRIQSEDIEVDGSLAWQLLAALVMYSAELRLFIVMATGSVANSYSVPGLLAFVTHGQDRRPAFFHDDSYDGVLTVCRGPGQPFEELRVTRRQADALIREACECSQPHMAWWRRRIIFRGTRLGGWAFFKRKPAAPRPVEPEPYESLKGE